MVVATEWKDLDYLIIDMPPGTSKKSIEIYQQSPSMKV